MIGKNDSVVSVIKNFIESQKRDKGIRNEIIRDGVFDIRIKEHGCTGY